METHASIKGQIVIPASLRRKYGIMNGTRIIVTDNGDSITLTPVNAGSLRKLQGSLKGSGALLTLVQERKRDLERE